MEYLGIEVCDLNRRESVERLEVEESSEGRLDSRWFLFLTRSSINGIMVKKLRICSCLNNLATKMDTNLWNNIVVMPETFIIEQ